MLRWRFLDITNPTELACRTAMLQRIDAWWSEFLQRRAPWQRAAATHSESRPPVPLLERLAAIHSQLVAELRRDPDGQDWHLTVTPENHRWLRPLVETILQRAPRVRNWHFHGYRPPLPWQHTLLQVKSRTGGDVHDAQVHVQPGRHRNLDLTVCLPDCRGPADSYAKGRAFVAAESLLGEEVLDTWIGQIQVDTLRRQSLWQRLRGEHSPSVPLADLKHVVDQQIARLRDGLPSRPCHELVADAPWATIELTPAELPDYPARTDILVACSRKLDVWEAWHAGEIFHSQCFSRCGETFCYLKFDHSAAHLRPPERSQLEDQLDQLLVPSGLGCTLGGATGLRYSYIDLALLDVDRGVGALRQQFVPLGLPVRSWLLFFESKWQAEWIGLHPDTEPPCMQLA